jgi:hypothetical protein
MTGGSDKLSYLLGRNTWSGYLDYTLNKMGKKPEFLKKKKKERL